MRKTAIFVLCCRAFVALSRRAAAPNKLDYAAIGQIRDEGLNRSQAMETLFWLTDRYGPRVTGTPAMEDAGAWTMKKMTEWGLANVHREDFDFGRGWSIVRFSAHMVEPQIQPLIGLPKTWSTGTDGPISAEVVRTTIATEADIARYKGQLKGKIVLAQPSRAVRMLEGPFIVRMDGELAKEAETTPIPAQRGRGGRGGAAARRARRRSGSAAHRPPKKRPAITPAGGGGRGNQQFLARVQQFYKDEGVVAVFDRGSDADTSNMGSNLSVNQQRPDGGTIFPGTVNRTAAAGVPQVTLAVEHYNRMVRLLEHNVPVKVELDVKVQFHENAKGFNVVGEIPGHRSRQRSRDARRALRLAFVRDRRDRQRDGIDGDAGSAAHHQDARPQAAAHDPRRALGRGRAGAARLARLRARALRRSADDGAEAGARETLGLLQSRQRDGQDPRHLDAEQSRRRGRSSSSGSRRCRISASPSSVRAASRPPITSRSTTSGCRRSSSCRIGWNTTRGRTTRTWTPTIASSATI